MSIGSFHILSSDSLIEFRLLVDHLNKVILLNSAKSSALGEKDFSKVIKLGRHIVSRRKELSIMRLSYLRQTSADSTVRVSFLSGFSGKSCPVSVRCLDSVRILCSVSVCPDFSCLDSVRCPDFV